MRAPKYPLQIVVLALWVAWMGGCRPQMPPVQEPVEPHKPPVATAETLPGADVRVEETETPKAVLMPTPAPTSAATDAAVEKSCFETPRQTGQGCNYEGIMAVLSKARAADGSIPACYRKHVKRPRNATLSVLLSLTPEGQVGDLQWREDDLKIPTFTGCLEDALKALRFPAPGDVPCQIVVPLTFVPEVSH